MDTDDLIQHVLDNNALDIFRIGAILGPCISEEEIEIGNENACLLMEVS